MPSPFETLFATAADAFYENTFGTPATYQGPDGAIVSVGVDGNPLVIRVQRHEATPEGDGETQTAQVIVRQSQLAKPLPAGRFTVNNNEVWTIDDTPTLRNGQHYCACSRGGLKRVMPRRAKR